MQRASAIQSVASLSPHCSTLSHKRHDHREKHLLNIKCWFWFSLQLLFEIFLILRIIQLDIVINMETSSCKIPVIPVGFQWNLNFLDRVFEKPQISNFMKILSVGVKLVHAVGWMDGRTNKLLFALVRMRLITHVSRTLAVCHTLDVVCSLRGTCKGRRNSWASNVKQNRRIVCQNTDTWKSVGWWKIKAGPIKWTVE